MTAELFLAPTADAPEIDWLGLLEAHTRAMALRAERDESGHITAVSWGLAHERLRLEIPTEVWSWPPAAVLAQVQASMRAHAAEQHHARWVDRQREIDVVVDHDIRNALATILATLAYVDTAPPGDDEVPGALADATASCRSVVALLDDLRLLSALAYDQTSVVMEPVVLAPLIADVRAAVEERGEGRVVVESECPPGLIVESNGALLERLVNGLADRRGRRGGRAGIFVDQRGEGVRIRITDAGCCVPEEERARVFDRPGNRNKSARELGNHGVRLYLCRLIAEALGGTLTLCDEPRWPTVLTVDLPGRPP